MSELKENTAMIDESIAPTQSHQVNKFLHTKACLGSSDDDNYRVNFGYTADIFRSSMKSLIYRKRRLLKDSYGLQRCFYQSLVQPHIEWNTRALIRELKFSFDYIANSNIFASTRAIITSWSHNGHTA